MTSTLRRNRFKPLIFSREARALVVTAFMRDLEPHLEAWRTQKITDFEVVGAYWTLLIQYLRPKDFRVGATPWAELDRSKESLTNNSTLALEPLRYRFRSSPLAAHSIYYKWYLGQVELVTTEQVPSSREVLALQCERKRIVTLITDPIQFIEETEGRDPYSFLLHDLVHADKFFGDEALSYKQAYYYLSLKQRLEGGEFDRFIGCDTFREKFDYLIADMNSHPMHLESYLNHIVTEAKNSGFRESENRVQINP